VAYVVAAAVTKAVFLFKSLKQSICRQAPNVKKYPALHVHIASVVGSSVTYAALGAGQLLTTIESR